MPKFHVSVGTEYTPDPNPEYVFFDYTIDADDEYAAQQSAILKAEDDLYAQYGHDSEKTRVEEVYSLDGFETLEDDDLLS